MDRERVSVVLVGVLCILAVVTAAATLSSPEQTSAEAGGESLESDGPDDYEGDGGESSADPVGSPGQLSFDLGMCVPWLYSGEFWFSVAAIASVIWLYGRHRQDSVAATAYVTVLAIPFTFAWLFFSKCGTEEQTPQTIVPSDIVATPKGGDGTFGILGDVANLNADVWVLVVVALVGIGAVAALLASDAGDADDPDDREAGVAADDQLEPVADLGDAAGRAADRIERSAGVDNEIYRAWVEMTEHLDVDHPDASTPGEFEAAAVNAGVDAETVAELTALFERVRYGDEAPTAQTESRAVDALRAIETSYSDLDEFWTDETE